MQLPEALQEDIDTLEQLYQDYQTNLAYMRKLIEEYDIVQRRLRVGLRKEQLIAKNKKYV